jgi:hypothetical protein
MEDVENGNYLKTGYIWSEINRRKSFARYAEIKRILSEYTIKTLYQRSRKDLLELISRKINYKENLIAKQDEEFTAQLHKQIANVENEINTLLSFIMSFDSMGEFLENETAKAHEQWYFINRKNLILNELLKAEQERVDAWSNTAFKLSADYLDRQLNPSKYTNGNK